MKLATASYIFLVELGLFIVCQASFANPAFDKAVAAYNSRQYSQALSLFQSIISQNPSDAMSHYYMGLCYQYLDQMSSAQREYSWVMDHSNNQSLRGNAQQALQQLSQWGSHREYAGQGNVPRPAPVVTGAAMSSSAAADRQKAIEDRKLQKYQMQLQRDQERLQERLRQTPRLDRSRARQRGTAPVAGSARSRLRPCLRRTIRCVCRRSKPMAPPDRALRRSRKARSRQCTIH